MSWQMLLLMALIALHALIDGQLTFCADYAVNVGMKKKKKQGGKICSFQLHSGIVGEVKVKYSQYPNIVWTDFFEPRCFCPPCNEKKFVNLPH